MNGIKAIGDLKTTTIGLVRQDIEKYGNIILEKYPIQIKEIQEKYIGGCILENETIGIFIDNTLLNSVNEILER